MDAMDSAILQYHGKETGNVSFEFSFEFSNENLCDSMALQWDFTISIEFLWNFNEVSVKTEEVP